MTADQIESTNFDRKSDGHSALQVHRLPVEQIAALRQLVLRPHSSLIDCIYHTDYLVSTEHYALRFKHSLAAIASVYAERFEPENAANAWRLRGMASHPDYRGRGFGGTILGHCINRARQQGIELLWCNARTAAAGFYRRFGFTEFGDQFELEGLGPHYQMVYSIDSQP